MAPVHLVSLSSPARNGHGGGGARRRAPAAARRDAGTRLDLTLEAAPDAPMLARRAVARLLEGLDAAKRDVALLLVSELVTNAVVHGSALPGDPVGVRVERAEDRVRIEVRDRGAGAPDPFGAEQLPREAHARSGWGLPIVAALCERWGIERERARTCVWCEVGAAA